MNLGLARDSPVKVSTTIQEIEKHSIIAWIYNNEIRNEKGDKINFYDYPFLYDIYRDKSQYLVVVKCAQCGLSTCECIKNHYDAKSQKMDIIYTLPTDADVVTFVSGKVNRIIANNPCMAADVKDKDSIMQKQVGQSMIYFRGTWTDKAAIMITADRLVHDEKDSSKQTVVEDYKARLDGQQSMKQRHVFSHPSFKGKGVDIEWLDSDQKEWVITCPHCAKKQHLEWSLHNPKRMSVDIEGKRYKCKACDGTLSADDRRDGRWMKRKGKENAKYSGYHISQMMAPRIPASEIVEKWDLVRKGQQTEEYFYNKVLGLPYAASDSTLSEETVLGSITTDTNPMDKRLVMGVDTGIKLRWCMGNLYGVVGYGEKDHWSEIEKMITDNPTMIVVIDAGGDIKGSREMEEKYKGRVFLCFYRQDRKSQGIIKWGEKNEAGTVVVDRNRMISQTVGEWKDGRVRLYNGSREAYNDFWLHWSHIQRTTEESNVGTPQYVWIRTDRDDWVHAYIYMRVGLDRFGENGTIVGVQSESHGDSPYINPNMTVDVGDGRQFNMLQEEPDDWRR